MSKRILTVGHCNYDHSQFTQMLTTNFEATILRSHLSGDTLELLKAEPVDLILLNRVYDQTGQPALQLLKDLKSDPELQSIPVMLISNYEDAQADAEAAGAIPGFGKSALSDASTVEKIRAALGT